MIKNFLLSKLRKINKRIKEIDEEDYLRGLDVLGTSAFKNMEIMDQLRKEKDNLLTIKRRHLYFLRIYNKIKGVYEKNKR